MQHFADSFPLTDETRVLDVGGTPTNWAYIAARPTITLLNLQKAKTATIPENMTFVEGNGCDLPYDDCSFDVVYSNSVIEHVGTWENQEAFAREVRRTGAGYFVQTPNRAFPIEPHWLGVGIHWLPRNLRAPIGRYTSIWGLVAKPSRARRDAKVAEVRLLTAKEMRELFPEARIQHERVLGISKALVAVYTP